MSVSLALRFALLAALGAAAFPALAQDEPMPRWKELRDEIRARQVEERRNFSAMTREERETLREKHRTEDRAWQRERDEYLKGQRPEKELRGRSDEYRDDDRYRRDESYRDDKGYRRDERLRGDDRHDRRDDDSRHGSKHKQKGKYRD